MAAPKMVLALPQTPERNCAEVRHVDDERCEEFWLGRLSEQERVELKKHCDLCALCARGLEQNRTFIADLREALLTARSK